MQDVELLVARPRTPETPIGHTILHSLKGEDRMRVLDEERSRTAEPMRWLVATPLEDSSFDAIARPSAECAEEARD